MPNRTQTDANARHLHAQHESDRPGRRHALKLRAAFSLLELLAVLVIVGVLATIIIPRLHQPSQAARRNACYVNRGEIELQVQRWYRRNLTWPASNLGDIGADPEHFPEGLPHCPVDGAAYLIDDQTHRVVGHDHGV